MSALKGYWQDLANTYRMLLVLEYYPELRHLIDHFLDSVHGYCFENVFEGIENISKSSFLTKCLG